MRALVAVTVMLFTTLTPLADDALLSEGRERSQAFLDGELAGIWDDMTPELQGLFGSIEKLGAFRAGVAEDFGEELAILSEEVQPEGDGVSTYLRTSKWSSVEAPIAMQWTIGEDDRVAAFSIKAFPVLADSRFLTYQTKTQLRLPFNGEWFVVWGGRTLADNYHAADRAQRFAVDALIYRDGMSYQGDGKDVTNYYCWDQPILAPAGGTVVAAVKELPDNEIDSTDTANPAGNHVVIDFGQDEFGFLGHMRMDSLKVAIGDTVLKGQELGRCGNSGNTSEPHLHFHLQNTTALTDGEGLPAFFYGYLADNQPVERGELVAGQIIQPE